MKLYANLIKEHLKKDPHSKGFSLSLEMQQISTIFNINDFLSASHQPLLHLNLSYNYLKSIVFLFKIAAMTGPFREPHRQNREFIRFTRPETRGSQCFRQRNSRIHRFTRFSQSQAAGYFKERAGKPGVSARRRRFPRAFEPEVQLQPAKLPIF